jgi:hypothetical protein
MIRRLPFFYIWGPAFMLISALQFPSVIHKQQPLAPPTCMETKSG